MLGPAGRRGHCAPNHVRGSCVFVRFVRGEKHGNGGYGSISNSANKARHTGLPHGHTTNHHMQAMHQTNASVHHPQCTRSAHATHAATGMCLVLGRPHQLTIYLMLYLLIMMFS
jgi:hypothetical protein